MDDLGWCAEAGLAFCWAFGAVAVVAGSSDGAWVCAVASGRRQTFEDLVVGLLDCAGLAVRGKNPPGQ